jgi:hypothetical protein
MKCKCPTETHGHEAGKCANLATEPYDMCKPCSRDMTVGASQV